MPPRIHSTKNAAGDFTLHLNDDGTWPAAVITNALLADIRRELRQSNVMAAQNGVYLLRIRDELRQLNRRAKLAGMTVRAKR